MALDGKNCTATCQWKADRALASILSMFLMALALCFYSSPAWSAPAREYDIGISKKVSGPIGVGLTATFIIAPDNHGFIPVTKDVGISVVDTLPASFGPPIAASGSNWDCNVVGLTVTCAYNGPQVGPGQLFPQITVTAVATRRGPYKNCAEISLKTVPDADPGNNQSCADGEIHPRVTGIGPAGLESGTAGPRPPKDGPISQPPTHSDATLKPVGPAILYVPVSPHGSWTQGPGTYAFRVCADNRTCNVTGDPGQSIPIAMEVWGGGGGGGGGLIPYGGYGGGGGGYSKLTIAVVVPASGITAFYVAVGVGGTGGLLRGPGGPGGPSEVRYAFPNGITALKAAGGKGGGNGGHGDTCNGQAGGIGEIGGGPGSINNGGNGGHGGYDRYIAFQGKTCLAHPNGFGQTDGSGGQNGKVVFTW